MERVNQEIENIIKGRITGDNGLRTHPYTRIALDPWYKIHAIWVFVYGNIHLRIKSPTKDNFITQINENKNKWKVLEQK